jgi:NAD(P)H-dependent flavin oxidoreductase YrpB (nitropropane dioxygenase family)
MEAGGHRGSFDPGAAEGVDVGLFALLPRFADHLDVPIVAAGGISDGRGVAAALTLGATAVQIGTALLRSPEAAIDALWAASLTDLAPERTVTTRAYSGRLGRAAPTPYVLAGARRTASGALSAATRTRPPLAPGLHDRPRPGRPLGGPGRRDGDRRTGGRHRHAHVGRRRSPAALIPRRSPDSPARACPVRP